MRRYRPTRLYFLLQEPEKLCNGHPCLPDDRFQGSAFQIFIMVGDRDTERRLIGMFQYVMTAGGMVDKKSCPLEGAEHLPRSK
jgi:hypothetical protein